MSRTKRTGEQGRREKALVEVERRNSHCLEHSYVEKSENSLKSSTSEMKGILDHVVQWLINS